MAHFKRKKNRRTVRCSLCTPHKWKGNVSDRYKHQAVRDKFAADQQMDEYRNGA
jgi:hypothetical protein